MEKYFSKTHEWVKIDSDYAIVGISRFAADELGDISYVEISKEGTDVIVGDSVASLETVNTSSEVFSPVSGTIITVNHKLDDDPGLASRQPEEQGWLYKLENIDLAELDDLMEEDEYQDFLNSL